MPSIDTSFQNNHTCLRIKDPKVSVPFYEEHFGMTLIKKVDFPEKKFSLYMMCIDADESTNWAAKTGVLELCHNHGSESDDSFKINSGNGETLRGFGHICFSVDNLEVYCKKLEAKGVKFQKKVSDGRQKNIAFALDPNGYWVELIEHGFAKVEGKSEVSSAVFNHTMVRVKDPKKSLDFYTKVLGFKLFSTRVHEGAKFTLYFLGYDHDDAYVENTEDHGNQARRISVLELTHNWGTESDDTFEGYHNGNSGDYTGYGHICVSCDDPKKFCAEVEAEFPAVSWGLKYDQGFIKKIAFINDPDGYSIEVIPTTLLQQAPCCAHE
ncbi:hypothetical protein BABINDRAFT_169150 [Babjeviella inositovora NRRL Y-12698]|uniref:Lactoylglutathione lyase n=1 Tax=Babjeviella inositovora NRRL Y-12698 TaxID=984486 RepID=A0A1E3QIS2_9ASCO|nr:uncharacterized protein BABINDRAFT_169150 [Babjeviella inositovora NRRL Y-12698]ODQ77550.1 hypothetical protein BABINDRAFT_169150 [Babjeviella inositovora NRRL Y-12698]